MDSTKIESSKIINFLITKNKVIDEVQINKLIEKYNTTNKENKDLINLVFSSITCYDLEMINNLDMKSGDFNKSITIIKEEHNCLLNKIKDLNKEIKDLTQEIKNIREVNSELRDSYYNLNQKMIKKTNNENKHQAQALFNHSCPKCGYNYSNYIQLKTSNTNVKYC